ncbi:MAG: cytochrome c biogenesis protein CcsA [Methylococcaceae bacterium]|nr:cytochrome c biogenesis protein CcsA [Methylococcaceae bacterium]
MNSLIITVLAAGAYLISALLLTLDAVREKSRHLPLYIAWFAVFLHAYSLEAPYLHNNTFNFNFFNIASLISSLVSLLLLIAATNKPVEKLGIALFPIAAIMLTLNHLFPHTSQTPQSYSGPMHLHILSSIIAFSLLNIAALQALLLAIHERQLRKHPPKRFILRLPPLQTMESLLFQMISTGMVFLSVSLISGFIFIEDLFAQHLAHKTVLSILAWFIFSGLLFGRIRYGWRGKTAVKWTLSGFLLLLLAYFGSKLVLELILHR